MAIGNGYLLLMSLVALSINSTLGIYGGGRVEPNSLPYVASLRSVIRHHFRGGPINYINRAQHICGAAILNERWVISSAFCVDPDRMATEKLHIYVGAHHYHHDGIRHSLARIVMHPNYDQTFKMNDLALLQTNEPIEFNDKVQPIPIETRRIGADEEGIFAGWGETESGLSALYLESIKLRTISNGVCKQMHLQENQMSIYDTKLCTFIGNGLGTCIGDAGGVLAIDGKLVGVLSWGCVPCAVGKPDQFERISDNIDFIRNVTGMEIA